VIRFRKKSLGLYLAILIFLALFICQPAFLTNIKATFVDIVKFPLKFSHIILEEIKIFIFSHSVYRENIKLRKEVDLLLKGSVNYDELSKENERLKKILSFKQKTSFSTIAARVVGRDSSNWISALIIDKGKKDGLEKDMPVINEVGLLGKIVEVGNSTSKMLLINDPDLKVAGLIQESREEGIVSGTLNGKCKMYFLALTSEVAINNIVVTSGLGGVFPKGLLIGKVIDVYEDPSGLTKDCLIEPATKLSRLEEVLVILK